MSVTTTDDSILTVRQVSDLTCVPESTLQTWARQRLAGRQVGPRVLDLGPRHRRWRRSDVEAWLSGATR